MTATENTPEDEDNTPTQKVIDLIVKEIGFDLLIATNIDRLLRKHLPAIIAEAEKRGARMTELKDSVFIKHIQNHLTEGQEVICKICNKSAEEIVATESGTLMAADKRYSEEDLDTFMLVRENGFARYLIKREKDLIRAFLQSLKPEGGE